MKIAIGADHAGYLMKNDVVARLKSLGHDVTDVGTFSPDSTDYPDFAAQVANRVAHGEAERGILVCSTGIGMSIAANKVDGIRAAVGNSDEEVRLARTHNNINVLTLGANFSDRQTADRWVDIFLESPFEGGRHERRVNKMMALESDASTTSPGGVTPQH
jgi:ribose 5-phosphate isomerase B